MTFAQRDIDVTITQVATGKMWKLSGHRVQCVIKVLGGITNDLMQMRIFGLPLSLSNELTAIGSLNPLAMGNNLISVAAGDHGKTLATVYDAHIFQSWNDYTSAPDVSFNVIAMAGAYAAIAPVSPTSFKGSVLASTVLSSIAQLAGFNFVNEGVTGTLINPYFSGTAIDQLRKCAHQSQVDYEIRLQTLSVWPKGASRTGDIPIISPATGMVSYPTFQMSHVSVRSIFLPGISLGMQFKIEGSTFAKANGLWTALHGVTHNLESQTPGGAWFTDLEGWNNVTA